MDASQGKVQNLKHFDEDVTKKITNNYSNCIGEGGFGKVYKGDPLEEYDQVAVKKCIRKELREEFMEEVRIHSKMKHKNIVKLIGYSVSENNLMLITEYICNGNLDDILHNSDSSIPLDIRLGIAIVCVEALSYMHSMHGNLVYHGDIKPANILLDDNFTAKVSDFGLSRLLLGGITRYTSMVVGSINYMDPVCFHTGCLTPKSDVYSFGIVLLELIARKRANVGCVHLVGAFANAKGGELRELFDSEIADKNNIEILQKMVKLANECLSLEIRHRPKINDAAKRLLELKRNVRAIRHENTIRRPILESYRSWFKKDKQDMVQLRKSSSFLKRNPINSKILLELRNLRRFTKDELNDITKNYSSLLGEGTQAKFYKGTVEDNTAVVVWKFLYADCEEAFINGGIILSQIVHKNIIRLLGYCLEAETLVLIYEYAKKGSLMDILGSKEEFPLDKRIGIAIKTAEALQYLHSSATGVVGHGSVVASTILVDNNYSPRLTDFSGACKLIKESEITGSVITRDFLEEALYKYPIQFMSVLLNLERDVYGFGGVLFALISRDTDISLDELVLRFTEAYQTDDSGKAIFDNNVITSEEEISVLEDLGRLALKCTVSNVDEMTMRPTMKEVAEQLHMIRRSWKGCTTEVATLIPEIEVRAEPRLPSLMRHLYGYRRIRW